VLFRAVGHHPARESRHAAVGMVRRQPGAARRRRGRGFPSAGAQRRMAARRRPRCLRRSQAAGGVRGAGRGAGGEMTLSPDEIVYFSIGPLNISATLVFTWVVIALLVGVSLL